jgi:hypothetical protein
LWERGGCGDQLKGCWWMEEILHHLGWWDKPPSSWCSISSINWSPVPTFKVPILSVSWMTTKTSVSEHVVRWMPMPINLLYPTCLRFAFVPTIPDFAVLYVFRLFYSFFRGACRVPVNHLNRLQVHQDVLAPWHHVGCQVPRGAPLRPYWEWLLGMFMSLLNSYVFIYIISFPVLPVSGKPRSLFHDPWAKA